ncbi:MAG TPA: sigma-54 dependent transcriptional regulator [Planctomycetota bacterium]|nr:sigma-54 dependent transcriptional regulator [Planctomycetota bacterium]
MAKILIADDKQGLRDVLLEALAGAGHEVEGVEDGTRALAKVAEKTYDLVVTDLKMPGVDGIELLRSVRERAPQTGVILMTAHGTVDTAVEAMRLGALDYVEKPFPLSAMEAKVEKALERQRLVSENAYLKEEIQHRVLGDEILGGSAPMKKVFELISKVSETTTPVLILGESGTGKELVAREIHRKSPRASGPFVAVNCAALAEGILESELFGHEKGSFTGATAAKKGKLELAEKGTLFLDEIGDIPIGTQVKLLRFLQEKEIERVGGNKTIKLDVRVLAATNRDLKKRIEEKHFREDLYYRVNVISIQIPPLRDRREDIPPLVTGFLERLEKEIGRKGTIDDEALSLLQMYDWPGNVRELENVIERALVLAEEACITAKDLPGEIRGGEGARQAQAEYYETSGLQGQIERIEREIIRKALEETDWNQTRAAQELGLKRSSLQYKMKKYNLSKPE